MLPRLTAAVLALSLCASTLPVARAVAESDTTIDIDVAAPNELPCKSTSGKERARCITDALKKWKNLEHDYDQAEDDVVDAWKAAHASMGIGSDYQVAVRAFLAEVRAERAVFEKKLLAYRKIFFAEQKAKRDEGDGRKATEVKLEKTTLDAAKAVCGEEDDDGAYRLCMRLQLRAAPKNVDRRSRTSPRLQRQGL